MRYLAVSVLALLACSAVALAKLTDLPHLHVLNAMPHTERVQLFRSMFDEYKVNFNKQYLEDEEAARFDIFSENMKEAAQLNAEDPSAKFGVTKFADLTDKEFASTILSNVSEDENVANSANAIQRELTELHTLDTPMQWDWTKRGYEPEIYDQGQCGSCWAFSAVETIEMATAIFKGKSVRLSPQQLVDCVPFPALGCRGGLPNLAFFYAGVVGLVSAEDYPYKAVEQVCRASNLDHPKLGFVSWYGQVPQDAPSIRAAIVKYGPVTAAVDASRWKLYQGGTITKNCWTGQSNHAVQIVGFDFDENRVAFWRVRNHWGSDWGMNGYVQLARETNTCGVESQVTAIVV